MTTQLDQIPVTRRALVQRINRRLAKADQKLCASRSWGERSNLGDFYLLDTWRNSPIRDRLSPEAFGRELGVLGERESVNE